MQKDTSKIAITEPSPDLPSPDLLAGKHPSETLAHGRSGRIVKKCTSVNPDDRFASAQKLAKAL